MPGRAIRPWPPTSPDDYSLTIEKAVHRYEHAGHPRTIRSIQRYCAQGHLDCLRQETPKKYLITSASVARHIAQVEEITRATSRDMSRPVAPNVSNTQARDIVRPEPATGHDEPRHVATGPDLTVKYIARLEGEIAFLREETITKNAQMKELTERSRETNLLIGGLQRMLAPLLGSPDPYPIKPDTAPD